MEDEGFSCQGGKTKHQVLSFLKHFRKPVLFFLCFLEIRAKFSICIKWESHFFPKHFVLSQNFCTFLGKPCFCSLFEHFENYVIYDFLIIFTNLVKGCLKSASQSPGKKRYYFRARLLAPLSADGLATCTVDVARASAKTGPYFRQKTPTTFWRRKPALVKPRSVVAFLPLG